MPIKPKPFVYKCLSCNWEKLITPQSDALSPLDHYDSCPECGNNKLEKNYLNSLKGLWGKLFK